MLHLDHTTFRDRPARILRRPRVDSRRLSPMPNFRRNGEASQGRSRQGSCTGTRGPRASQWGIRIPRGPFPLREDDAEGHDAACPAGKRDAKPRAVHVAPEDEEGPEAYDHADGARRHDRARGAWSGLRLPGRAVPSIPIRARRARTPGLQPSRKRAVQPGDLPFSGAPSQRGVRRREMKAPRISFDEVYRSPSEAPTAPVPRLRVPFPRPAGCEPRSRRRSRRWFRIALELMRDEDHPGAPRAMNMASETFSKSHHLLPYSS